MVNEVKNFFFLLSVGFILLDVFGLIAMPLSAAPQPADTNYDEAQVPDYQLPPLLKDLSNRSAALKKWNDYRRAEVLRLFEESVYGKTPSTDLKVRYEIVDVDKNALEGLATRKQVAIFLGPKDYRLDLLLYIPNGLSGPAPAFLGLNFNGNHTITRDPAVIQYNKEKERGSSAPRWQLENVIGRGYALATMHRDQIDPDNYRHDFSDGIHPLFYGDQQTQPGPAEWGSIGAWAWALSKSLDYLETESALDQRRVAVIGHSRLGKTALWAGAQDPRFALVVSNNSGCGGAALYRRCFGERIHHMVKPIGYWFCRNHHQFQKKESELPVDQHMLLALIAPRPLYVASATRDRWADPKGEFLAAKHASPIYELFGCEALGDWEMPNPNQPIHTQIGYHLRDGKHDVTAYDWNQYLDFADRVMVQEQ